MAFFVTLCGFVHGKLFGSVLKCLSIGGWVVLIGVVMK